MNHVIVFFDHIVTLTTIFEGQGAWEIATEFPILLKPRKGEEEKLMFKKIIRWILPFLALTLIAMYLLLFPVLVTTHAAAPMTHTNAAVQHTVLFHATISHQTHDIYWHR